MPDLFPVSAWISAGAARLAAAGIEAPVREARLLLAHALGVSQARLLLDREQLIPATADAALARRCGREPLALIVGRQGFWTLDLAVSADTLVPRPDSEALIIAALAAFPERGAVRRVLDLGTGTGCLLLALLSEFPAAWGVGVELVVAAATLARRNAAECGLADRAAFLAGDWSGAIEGRFDLIVSNPPYIETAVIAGLMPEVAAHEPATALDGGSDGLACFRALLPAMPGLLTASGAVIVEIGQGQEDAVWQIAAASGLARAGQQTDLGGVVRALVLRRAPA